MLKFYLNSPLVPSLFDVNAMVNGAHRGQTQNAVHIQLHKAKNEQPQGETLQNGAT